MVRQAAALRNFGPTYVGSGVIRDRRGGSHTPMHVRFAPKADKIAGAPL